MLATALKSAYLLADVENYITLSLEFMAEKICRSAETKCKVQSDLLQLICVSYTVSSVFVTLSACIQQIKAGYIPV